MKYAKLIDMGRGGRNEANDTTPRLGQGGSVATARSMKARTPTRHGIAGVHFRW